jgi:hypothetical protein
MLKNNKVIILFLIILILFTNVPSTIVPTLPSEGSQGSIIIEPFLKFNNTVKTKLDENMVPDNDQLNLEILDIFKDQNDIEIDDGYRSHLLSAAEVSGLKAKIGVWNPNDSYDLIIQGHGTGLTPPTEDDWAAMIGNVEVVESVSLTDLPDSIDHSKSTYFPQVRSQGSSNSCTAFAVTYYSHGFYQAREHGWNKASTGDNAQLLSPAWTYNKINKGRDDGSNFWRNFQVLKTQGAATWSKMPFVSSDHLSWGDPPAWREAPKYRAVWYKQTDAKNIEVIKSWLNDGFICPISIDGTQYDGLGVGDDTITSSEYNSTSHNHANALVGYDDNKIVDGEIGAFKAVNSWGSNWGVTKGGRNNSGGWNGSGFYWFTYKAFAKLVRPVYIFQDMVDYEPKLLATWEFEGNCSRDATIKVGSGRFDVVKLNIYRKAGYHNYPKFMCMDITSLSELWDYSGYNFQNYFLEIGSGINKTNVTSFKIEFYETDYNSDGTNAIISRECPEVPKSTPNFYNNSGHGFFAKIENPKEHEYYQDMLRISGTAKENINITVINENFETTFPKGWILGDNNPNSGLDYWGNTTYRSSSGLKSGWCGANQVPIFFEDFDSYTKFQSNWIRNSENTTYRQPWNLTNKNYSFVYNGSDYGVVCNSNQSQNITELMYSRYGFNTSDYSSISLEFLLEFNKSNSNDYAQVLYANDTTYPNFTVLSTWTDDTWGLQRLDLTAAAGEDSIYLGFKYHGENGNYMFIDDIKVTRNISLNNYDNDMFSFMNHEVNLTRFDITHLTYDYWLDTENNSDILSVLFKSNNTWSILENHSGTHSGWKTKSVIIPNNATEIGFWFLSNGVNSTYNGVFLDNIELIGYLNITSLLITSFGPTFSPNGLISWSKNVDTQQHQDGIASIVLTAKYGKSSNYHTYDQRVFHIDNLPPESFIPTANPSSWTSDRQPIVTFATTDQGSFIDHYEVKIDDGAYSTQTSPYKLPTQNDGIHNITVRATDHLGNNRFGFVDVFIDSLKPAKFTPIAKPDHWTSNTQPVITFNTTDLLCGIEYYMLKVDNGNFSNQSSPCTMQPLSQGIHTVTVRAFDYAQNYMDSTVDVKIDFSPPESFTPKLTPSTWTSNYRPILKFSTSDNLSGVSHYEIMIDDVKFTTQETSYLLPELKDGIHNITVRAYDLADNYLDAYTTAYIDITPPEKFTPISKPHYWTNQIPLVQFNTIDNTSGVDRYELKINDGDFSIQLSPYQLPELEDGYHFITIRAFDNAGNYREEIIDIYLDRVEPTIEIIYPRAGIWVSDRNLTLFWECDDDRSGVDKCILSINDDPQLVAVYGTDNEFNRTLPDLEDGEHTISIKVLDRAGNYYTKKLIFKLDSFPPLMNIEYPKNNDYITIPTITIKWLCEDYFSDINYSEIKLNNGDFKDAGPSSEYTFANLADGTYEFTIRSYDFAGNYWEETGEFKLDSTKPNLTLLEPELGVTIKKSKVKCKWLGEDSFSGIDHYELRLDDGDYINLKKTKEYTFENLLSGEHTIRIRAYDQAGNSNEIGLNIKIDRPDKDSDGKSTNDYTGLTVVFVIIIIVVIILLILFMKPLKKSPKGLNNHTINNQDVESNNSGNDHSLEKTKDSINHPNQTHQTQLNSSPSFTKPLVLPNAKQKIISQAPPPSSPHTHFQGPVVGVKVYQEKK